MVLGIYERNCKNENLPRDLRSKKRIISTREHFHTVYTKLENLKTARYYLIIRLQNEENWKRYYKMRQNYFCLLLQYNDVNLEKRYVILFFLAVFML